ncbi:hypothetical protein EHQ12_02090 [Leptospira gomenensis]|uniref:Cys-rich protein n=1 Tax=Leptospira gomenensis TaxID=2484974 RepID=A0A5F1YIL4_9LEPT|nr:hypothetical protein [Leptospira gomenensis]TGK31516.1 hypothetical protein EHQ17_13985 [Leptospira gomenensis]TGK44166.1 hypothetical protein EHQ12_02090 [Leptospira gomenensis]TGK46221.1 hypothetical protein EHQ07_07220 [Leptospira gomenensis]TGK54746.1 hypothetical protein EHQ13_18810 [Leptospira gomenensis]
MKKLKNYNLLILFLYFFSPTFSAKADEDDVSREVRSIQKECSKKLESCLSRCDEEFPNFRNVKRGYCRDACVLKSKDEEGCLIYFSSSRR